MDSDIFQPEPEAISQVLSLIKTGKPAGGHLTRAVNLLDGRFVKSSGRDHLLRREASAMEFIRQHTTIPVPKVHMVFTQDRTTYLVMDAISGSTLEAAAFKMEATALERTAQQLRAAVDQLWSLTSSFPSPGEDNYYGQWPGTSFASCNRRFALKETVPAFSSFRDLLSYILSSASDVDLAMNLEGKLDSDDTRPMLTHGDLAPHNIMVDKTSGDILAILDWEMFGWYPAFWERMFVLMCCGQKCLRDALEPAFDGALEKHLIQFAWKVWSLNPE